MLLWEILMKLSKSPKVKEEKEKGMKEEGKIGKR